jgi:hypothetical protein
VTFGFVGDPGSFLSQCQCDSRHPNLFLTVRLTALRSCASQSAGGAKMSGKPLRDMNTRAAKSRTVSAKVSPEELKKLDNLALERVVARGYVIKDQCQAGRLTPTSRPTS